MTTPKFDNIITSWRDNEGNGMLHTIARIGNESVLNYLLIKKFCYIETLNMRGETPLLVANYSHPNIVRLLLNFGANVHVENEDGQTPLHLAVLARNEQNVALLIDAGVDVTLVDLDDKSALYIAVESNMLAITRLLLDRGIDVNQEFEESRSVLSVATRARNIPMIHLLIQYGSDVTYINPDLTSPLHFAVWLDEPTLPRLMLEQGADVNQQDSDGFAVLHEAVYEGNLWQVQLLLEYQANIHVRTNEGDTPLHWAVCCNIPDSSDVIKYLMEQGANINEPNFDGTTSLHFAAKCCSLTVFKMCLDFGGDFRIKNEKKETILHFAAKNCNVDVLEFVLEKTEFDLNERNFSGFTPLHYAAEVGNVRACAFLINKGADLNARSNDGKSPLFLATRMRQVKTVKFLLKFGAGIVESVMDAVEGVGYQQMSIVLVRHLAKLNCLRIVLMKNDFFRIRADKELNVYFGVCGYELNRMRETKIFENVSIFDILTKRLKVLRGYARNKELVKAFEEQKDLWKYPNYGEEMKERFMQEVRKQRITTNATIVLNEILPFDNPRHVVMEKIVSYLGFDDLVLLALELDEVREDKTKLCKKCKTFHEVQ